MEERKFFEQLRESMVAFRLPRWKELPDVELYMDQVVSVLDKYLSALAKEGDEEGRTVTSSMINNYVKMGVIPPPERKKYGRGHLSRLIMLTMLKQVLSIGEIGELLRFPEDKLADKYDFFCETQEHSFLDPTAAAQEAAAGGDPLKLALIALTGKICAQRILERRRAARIPKPKKEPEKKEKEPDRNKEEK